MLSIRSPTTHRTYELRDILSTGRFAAVYDAVDRDTKTRYAIKTLLHDRHDLSPYANNRMIQNETRNWPKVSGGKGVLKLEEIIVDDSTRQTYLVSELCMGGTLKQNLDVSLVTALRCMKETLVGIHTCHDAEIIHGDLKPENILLTHALCDGGHIRIADFGSSIDANGQSRVARALLTHCTPLYAAPEIMEQWGNEICFKVDMWSFGIL